jgi:hypothetical protein
MQSFLILILSLTALANGFHVSSLSKTTRPTTTTSRSATLGIQLEDENSYRYLMARARECAFSDYTTSTEARQYLQAILHLEEGCISGSLTGHDLCDNVNEMAEIVAHLRQKVKEDTFDIRCVKVCHCDV